MTPKPPSKNKPSLSAGTLPGLPEVPTVVRTKGEVEALAAPAEWALVAYAGAALGRVFPLAAGEVIVGRAPESGVPLLDSEVSRQHARFRAEEGRVWVEDLDSTNGTRVNGALVRGPATRWV